MKLSPTMNEVVRYGVTAGLAYGAYTALYCPCTDPFLSCHYNEFMAATAGSVAVIVFLNYF